MSVNFRMERGARSTATEHVCDLRSLLPELLPKLDRIVGTNVDLITLLPPHACRVAADAQWTSHLITGLVSVARAHIARDGWIIFSARSAGASGTVSMLDDDGCRGYAVVSVSLSDEWVDEMPAARGPHLRSEHVLPMEGRLATLLSTVTEAGGHCVVESQEGGGETLSVLLPMAHAEFERELAVPPALHATSARVLLIFADPMVRFITSVLLEAIGLSVTAVATTEKAVEVLKEMNHKIQLVLANTDGDGCGSLSSDSALSVDAGMPPVLAVGTVRRSGGGIRYALARDDALQPTLLDGAALAAHVRHCLRR